MKRKTRKRKIQADEKTICPSCLAPNSRMTAFCEECGSPIGAVATIDPVQSIRAEAFAMGKAVERPKLLTLLVLGIPMLFIIVVSLTIAIKFLLYERGHEGFIMFWMMIAAATLCSLVLYRISKNYVISSKKY